MAFFKFQLEYFCNQAELHATLDHCALFEKTLTDANCVSDSTFYLALCRTAETFLKYSNRSLQYFTTSHPQSQSTFRGPDAKVKAILEKLLNQENRVLDYWTQKKKRLDQAQQFCLFERSARQSLAWIKEEGDNYLATHTEVTQVKYSSSACTIFQMTK